MAFSVAISSYTKYLKGDRNDEFNKYISSNRDRASLILVTEYGGLRPTPTATSTPSCSLPMIPVHRSLSDCYFPCGRSPTTLVRDLMARLAALMSPSPRYLIAFDVSDWRLVVKFQVNVLGELFTLE